MREAHARASRLERDSLLSVEQVGRLGHDLDQQRILIDRHIDEAGAEKMGELDRRLADTATDLQHAIALYAPLVELPDEAAEWRQAKGAIERFEAALEDALQFSRRDLDAFAGRVAHDLKNAITPIVLSTPMLRRAASDPTRVIELVDRTDRSAHRAIGIIEALLTFSRAETAGGERRAELRPALEGVVEEVG